MITKTTVDNGEITKEHCDTHQLNEIKLFQYWGEFLRVTDNEIQVCETKHHFHAAPLKPDHAGEKLIESIDKTEVSEREPDELDLTTEKLSDEKFGEEERKRLMRVDCTNRNEVREINTDRVSRDEIEALNEPSVELILVTVIGEPREVDSISFELIE